MAGIFISYRRNDAPGVAGRLGDRLALEFSQAEIFMDVDAMQPGLDFVEQLDEQVSKCAVFLAVIGPDWAHATDDQGRLRLSDPADYVRIEIASALKRGIPVIPLLVHGAAMPAPDELPDDLKSLGRRHAMELRHTRFKADCDAIVQVLRGILQKSRAPTGGKALRYAAPGVLGLAILGALSFWWLRDGSIPSPAVTHPVTAPASQGTPPQPTLPPAPDPQIVLPPAPDPVTPQPSQQTPPANSPTSSSRRSDNVNDPPALHEETPATRVNSFALRSPASEGFDPGVRKWTRTADNNWRQEYPHGSVQINLPLKRANVKGCDGTVIFDPTADPNFESFIPDKRCPNMAYYFRRLPSHDWIQYVPIENVK